MSGAGQRTTAQQQLYVLLEQADPGRDLRAEIQELLLRGASLLTRDAMGDRPLAAAIASHNLSAIRALVALGAPLVERDGYEPPIKAALRKSDTAARLLIELGAPVTSQGGESPLALAAQFWRARIIPLMIAKGADVNEKAAMEPPLFDAVGDAATTAALLECGAEVNAANSAGQRPVHLVVDRAMLTGTHERLAAVLSVLLEYGADLDTPSDGGVVPREQIKRSPALCGVLKAHEARVAAQRALAEMAAPGGLLS